MTKRYLSTTVALFLIYCFPQTFSYKILLVSHQMVSHVLEQVSMGSVLLQAGHEVHIALESEYDPNLVKRFRKEGFRLENFREPDDFMRFSGSEFKKFLGNQIFNSSLTVVEQIPIIIKLFNNECTFIMEDKNFLQRIKDIEFDLVVIEPNMLHMCTLILPKYLNLPFITLTNVYWPFHIRSPALPSFYPRQFITVDSQQEMSFYARFVQLLFTIAFTYGLPTMNANRTLLQKYAPEVTTWEDLLRESLLFFSEVDHHFNNFLPSLPNHISLAGLTCSPAKPLPENILKFVNGRMINGKDPGLILMTFGSTAGYMPKEIVKKFLKVFSALNETVIAKLFIGKGDQELSSLIPPNVLVLNWLPQNDILGYPSTKLFITHCGNNGQHEALYHGVPMLGFPLFAEQDGNCRRTTVKGFSLCMDIFTFTEAELFENILEMLNNPKYRTSIQRMSKIFKEQPISTRKKALFWVEHVIKYGGDHLRSSAMDLSLYQFLCFDTIAVLVLIIMTTLYLIMKVLKCFWVKILKHYDTNANINIKKKQR